MNQSPELNFEYLNHGGEWPRFTWSGLDVDADGALRLAALPALGRDTPRAVTDLPDPDGPAGLAIGPDGSVYWTDPSGDVIWRQDGCDGSIRPLPCLDPPDGGGSAPSAPRGLMLHPTRHVLMIADSEHHRLLLIEPDSWQRIAVWGREGAGVAEFNLPWSIAADAEGSVYVVDYGNARVQKFDAGGRPLPFWDRASAAGMSQPAEVAVAARSGVVYVRDAERVHAFDAVGNHRSDFDLAPVTHPLGLAATEQSVYVGATQRRRIARFRPDGTFVGESPDYDGPVAALLVDDEDGLWVHPGGGTAPLRLDQFGGYVNHGVLWGGPVGSGAVVRSWHRLSALGNLTSEGARFRLFAYSAEVKASTPPPPAPDSGDAAFTNPVWREFSQDNDDVLVGIESKFLWIGAHLAGSGDATPVLEQLRIDFDQEGYIRHLPAVYRKKGEGSAFLEKLLALYESAFNDVEFDIETLARYFDPAAVPSAWLAWLAEWLGLRLKESWTDEQQRRAIEEAFESYTWRGTARGLRAAIKRCTGLDVHIEEPLVNASWWSLPDEEATPGSALGFDTRLAGAEPQGAVVGTTAVLDESQLITQDEYGAPLFEQLAHQFVIYVHRAQVGDSRRLEELHRVVRREKPAHTAYEVCLIDPRVLLGYQATVGIDTVVGGGPPTPSRLGDSPANRGVVLAGDPAGRIGHERVGQTTRLGSGTVT